MKTIIAISAIALLTGFALYLGYNGGILNTTIAVLAGLGGYTLGKAHRAP